MGKSGATSGASLVGVVGLACMLGLSPVMVRQSLAMTDFTSLQRRLSDAGCYKGPIDGRNSAGLGKAVDACPDQTPTLRIETGMHTAKINSLAVDAACRRVVTGSSDKTIRVWSLPDGRLERTLRPPIADGSLGMVYTVDLSADGRWLVAGGYDALWAKKKRAELTLIDLNSGAIRRLGNFEATINAIAITPDGRRIAVGLHGTQGVRILDRETGRQLMADRSYGDRVAALTFAADGTLFAASSDGSIRRYGADSKLAAKRAAPDGKKPTSLAFDPQGNRLAVGYDDQAKASILRPNDLNRIATAEITPPPVGNFLNVTWSADGSALFAAGSARDSFDPWARRIHRFSPTGAHQSASSMTSLDNVLDLKPCGTKIVYAAFDPVFGLLDVDGTVRVIHESMTADMRGKKGSAFGVSWDGATLAFGSSHANRRPSVFDLAMGTLGDAGKTTAGLSEPSVAGLPITDWRENAAPKLGGKPIALEKHERSLALAIRPDLGGFVLGADWSLRAFDASGRQRWRKAAPGPAWGVNLTRNGDLVVAAHADGTIRWYRWKDGVELLALFVEAPSKRWVAWTPAGHYMASPGGEDLIGWQLNRGWEQEPDFFPAARFRDRFNRPDVVQRVLGTLDVAEAVAAADVEARRKVDDGSSPVAKMPPVLRITTPAGGTSFSAGRITIEYDLRSPSGLAVDRIEILIDGRPVINRGIARVDTTEIAPGAGRVEVDLPPRDVEVGLIARAGTLASEPARLRLTHTGAAPTKSEDILKPKLYVLAVGNTAYADPTLTLGFAAKDARDFASVLKRQEGGLYGAVETKILVDATASRDGVLEGFEWLERQVTSRDVAVVFLAGHGVTDEKGTFWYLPNDASPKTLRSRGVSQDDLKRTMQALPSKAILFLDSCHAAKGTAATALTRGAVDVNSVVNDLAAAENGVVTFAASTGRELAQESADWGNGAFTKALIEGIGDGKAATLGNGRITLSELDAYVADRVKALTSGTQHPVMTRPATVTNFPIALVGR